MNIPLIFLNDCCLDTLEQGDCFTVSQKKSVVIQGRKIARSSGDLLQMKKQQHETCVFVIKAVKSSQAEMCETAGQQF